MYNLFYTPTWFHGWDLIFEGIGFLVALLVALYSWRVYSLNKENKYAYFSLAFVLVALGFLLEILTSGILYFTPVRDVAANVLRPIAGEGLKFSHLLYRGGFFFQMVPFLGAWLLIFFISQKSRARLTKYYEVSQIALFIYLIVLVSIVANFKYFVFYLTSAVLLGLIVLNYYKNYLNNRNKNTFLVMVSFLLILIGNIFFVFVFLYSKFYVIGEMFLLTGFLSLLYVYHKITHR